MLNQMGTCYYFVKDVPKAVQFYTQTLGLKVTEQSEYWASIQIGTQTLGLHKTEFTGQKTSADKSAGAVLTFNVDDIDKAYRHFSERGVKFTTEISRDAWGNLVSMVDLDGNQLDLIQLPKK